MYAVSSINTENPTKARLFINILFTFLERQTMVNIAIPDADNVQVDPADVGENIDDVMHDAEEPNNGFPNGHNMRRRKLTSKVWSKFDILPLGPDKQLRAKCRKCSATYLCSSRYGTGNLKRHIASCVQQKILDLGQLVVSHKDNGSLITRSSRFDADKFRELLVEAIVMHDLPFQFVEYAGIRKLFTYICADIKLISRNTAKEDIMRMHAREMKKLKKTLISIPSRICLTSDLWTSIATDGYLALTAHFIDDDWILQKRVLNFSFMPPPHTGVALSDKIYKLLVDWGIERKLFSMTLDNASTNDCFVELLKGQLRLRDVLLMDGEFFHVRCCAHILNLIVQEGLKEIDGSILKIRESIKYVKGSQGRKQKFLDCVAQVSLECKRGLRQDVPTRWNSTFLMVDSAIYYQRAFLHMQLSDSNYKHALTQEEWKIVEKTCKFLKVFYDVTCLFSGNKYPTANLYFPQVFVVEDSMRKAKVDPDIFMSRMASKMIPKFEKYWSEYSLILAIAVILDPRYKLQFVEFSYRRLYGNDSIELKRVRDKLFSVFDVYMQTHAKSNSSSTSSSLTQHTSQTLVVDAMTSEECKDVMKDFDDFEREEFVFSPQKTQLQLYLDEPRLPRTTDLNVLQFWKANQYRYRELSFMARDVLSIPISTVASESAFSVGGRVLDQYRSALKPQVVEALICTRDWIFADEALHNMLPIMDELTEDITKLSISDDGFAAAAAPPNEV